MGFAEGFRAGQSLVDAVLQEQRQRKLDARAEEEFGWKRTRQQREEEDFQRKNDWWNRQAVGAAPEGAPAQAGLVLSPQEGEFSGADASDALQGAAGMRAGAARGEAMPPAGAPQPAVPVRAGQEAGAITGTAPAPGITQQADPRAAGAKMPDVTAQAAPKLGRDRLNARKMQELGIATRDANVYFQGQEAEKKAHMSELTANVMNMPEEEIKARLSGLNTNLSSYPMLLTKVDPKTGQYTFTMTDPGGEPGKEIKLNAVQARQVVLAHELSQAQFGAEGMTMLSGVSKELGEHIKAYNEAAYKAGHLNVTSQHYADDKSYKDKYLAETGRHHKATEDEQRRAHKETEARARAGDFEPLGISQDRQFIEVYDNKFNRTSRVPVPAGTDPEVMLKMMQQRSGGGRGRAGSEEPKKVPAAGEGVFKDPKTGSLVTPNGEGGWMDVGAPPPAERSSFLVSKGMAPENARQVRWSDDGKYIEAGGKMFPRDKVAEAEQHLVDQGAGVKRLGESTRNAQTSSPANYPVRGLGRTGDPNMDRAVQQAYDTGPAFMGQTMLPDYAPTPAWLGSSNGGMTMLDELGREVMAPTLYGIRPR